LTYFLIRFSPADPAGAKEAEVSIANNDSNESPFTFKVKGTKP
jgi:hypothetical protein